MLTSSIHWCFPKYVLRQRRLQEDAVGREGEARWLALSPGHRCTNICRETTASPQMNSCKWFESMPQWQHMWWSSSRRGALHKGTEVLCFAGDGKCHMQGRLRMPVSASLVSILIVMCIEPAPCHPPVSMDDSCMLTPPLVMRMTRTPVPPQLSNNGEAIGVVHAYSEWL